MDEYEGIDEVVHEPSEAFAESTNVAAFMREYGIDDYETLIERTTSEVAGEPASGVNWFWDEVVDYLDIDFYTEYDRVRDDTTVPSSRTGIRAARSTSRTTSSTDTPRSTHRTGTGSR